MHIWFHPAEGKNACRPSVHAKEEQEQAKFSAVPLHYEQSEISSGGSEAYIFCLLHIFHILFWESFTHIEKL